MKVHISERRLSGRVLVGGAIAAALMVAAPASVGSADPGRRQPNRHKVEFTRTTVGTPEFAFVTGPNGEFLVSVSGSTTFSGDLQGSGFGAGFGTANDDAEVRASGSVSVWTLTGSPCGAGTVIVTISGVAGPDGEDNRWRIAAGGGTEDLVHMSGDGTYVQDGLIGEWVGTVRCS